MQSHMQTLQFCFQLERYYTYHYTESILQRFYEGRILLFWLPLNYQTLWTVKFDGHRLEKLYILPMEILSNRKSETMT